MQNHQSGRERQVHRHLLSHILNAGPPRAPPPRVYRPIETVLEDRRATLRSELDAHAAVSLSIFSVSAASLSSTASMQPQREAPPVLQRERR